MKRCAHCGHVLQIPHEGVVIESTHVAGVPSGLWLRLQFCSPMCSFNSGATLGKAISSGHTIALGPEQVDIFDSVEQAVAQSPRFLN